MLPICGNHIGGGVSFRNVDTPWAVTAAEKAAYDKFFKARAPPAALCRPVTAAAPALILWYRIGMQKADKDGIGLVKGAQVMGIFKSSKLPKETLAHVWYAEATHPGPVPGPRRLGPRQFGPLL